MSVCCRYEDNGDAVNNIAVMVQSTDKNSITGFGDTAKFLEDNKYLLGKQVFVGAPAHFNQVYSMSCVHTKRALSPCHTMIVSPWSGCSVLRSLQQCVEKRSGVRRRAEPAVHRVGLFGASELGCDFCAGSGPRDWHTSADTDKFLSSRFCGPAGALCCASLC